MIENATSSCKKLHELITMDRPSCMEEEERQRREREQAEQRREQEAGKFYSLGYLNSPKGGVHICRVAYGDLI